MQHHHFAPSTKPLVLGTTLTPFGLFLLRQAERLAAVDDVTVLTGEYPDGYVRPSSADRSPTLD